MIVARPETAPSAATGTEPATIAVHNPATGEKVGEVRAATAQDVARHVERARQAQPAWRDAGFAHRARVLTRFLERLLGDLDPVLDTIQNETGKARRDAMAEALTVAGATGYYVAHGEALLRPERRRAAIPGLTSAEVVYKPHGVVGMITPWNYPFLLVAGDAVAALLAGNAVVVKPSEITPLSAEKTRQLLIESGLPEDLFQVAHGSGPVAGGELLRHIDYAVFTGGTATGRIIARACAERLIPYSLELGGKNPMIVTRGARIPEVVSGLLAGAYSNSGQSCITVERIYVEQPAYESFLDEAARRLRQMRLGWGRELAIDMGSMISADHHRKVMSHIEDALGRGARAVAGGKARPDLGPYFVEPTLLTGVDATMRLHREETFGPVAAVYPVQDVEEALRLANDTEYGLNASVWAKSIGEGRRIARRIDAGSTGVNSTLLIFHSFDVGQGGIKASGLGRRHGPLGLRRFTQAQSVFSSVARGGGYDSLLVRAKDAGWQKLLARVFRLRRHLPGLR